MFESEEHEPGFDDARDDSGSKLDRSYRPRRDPSRGASVLAVGVGLLISAGGLAAVETSWPDPEGMRIGGAVLGLGLLFVIPGAWPGSPRWALWMLVVMGGAGALVFFLAMLAGAIAGAGAGACCAIVPLSVFLLIMGRCAEGLKENALEPPGFPVDPVELSGPTDHPSDNDRLK